MVYKLLARKKDDFAIRILVQAIMGNSLKQMCFTKTDRAVEKERVETAGLSVGDSQRGGMGKSICATNHEVLETVVTIQDQAFRGLNRSGKF